MKHAPIPAYTDDGLDVHPLLCVAVEPLSADLYTADDPMLWDSAMRARYGDNYDQEMM